MEHIESVALILTAVGLAAEAARRHGDRRFRRDLLAHVAEIRSALERLTSRR